MRRKLTGTTNMRLFKRDTTVSNTSSLRSMVLEDGSLVDITTEVNALGSVCPGPQLKAMKAMAEAISGDIESIKIDNPNSLETVIPMCDNWGATHLGTFEEGHSWSVLLQKND